MIFLLLSQLLSNCAEFSRYLYQLQNQRLDSHVDKEVVSNLHFCDCCILLHYDRWGHFKFIHFLQFMIEILNSIIYLSFFLQFLNCFQCQLYPYLFQDLEQGNLLDILMVYLIYVPMIILD